MRRFKKLTYITRHTVNVGTLLLISGYYVGIVINYRHGVSDLKQTQFWISIE